MSTTVKSITEQLTEQHGSFLTTIQVSEVLQISIPTLKSWRANGTGIPYTKISKFVRYLPQDIAKYIITNKVKVV